MIPTISWRNIWRNKLRSGVVITAVALGVFAGVFSMAFMLGVTIQRINSAVKTEVSHVQLHNPAFLEVSDLNNYFTGSDSLLSYLAGVPEYVSASRRVVVNAMINSAEKGGGIKLVGIEPDTESMVTDIKTRLIEGSYLEPLDRGKSILIGEKLAQKLDVKPRSKLVVTCLDLNFQPVYYQFRVGGIFRTVSTAYDESTAFIHRTDLLEITGLPPDAAHEIAIYLSSGEASKAYALELDKTLPHLSVQEWQEVMPELGYLTETMDLYMYIFLGVILLALGFGIVNTMLMVVLERIKEIGMLMAVGMNKRRIFGMIMLETVFLSLTGGVVGIVLGSLVSLHFAKTGIDLTALYGEGLASFGYDAFVYTAITPGMVITTALLVVLTGVLASIYPARKALKLNPSEALQTA